MATLLRTLVLLTQGALVAGAATALVCAASQSAPNEHPWDAPNKEGRIALSKRRFEDAERLFRQAVSAAEKGGKNSLPVADSLTNLSAACYALGKSDCALSTLRRALRIRTAALGPEHADVATTWDQLGDVFLLREILQTTVVMTQEVTTIEPVPSALGSTSFVLDPFRFDPLSSLDRTWRVSVHLSLGQTESCLEKALTIREKVLPASHPDLMRSLYRLARVYVMQRKLAAAKEMFQRLLALKEKAFGSGHLEFAETLGDLARVYYFERKLPEAASHYERALSIYEGTPETNQMVIAGCLFNLGEVYHTQKRYLEAEQQYLRATAVLEKARGAEDPNLMPVLRAYATLLRAMNRADDAKLVGARAAAIRSKAQSAVP